jgi:hypothetical protein
LRNIKYKFKSQRFWWHICKTAQANTKAIFCKRTTKPTLQDRGEMTTNKNDRKEGQLVTAAWRNGGCSASYDSFMVGSSEVLRLNFCAKNPPLRQAAKRYVK